MVLGAAKSIRFKSESMEAGPAAELMVVLAVGHESLTVPSCISSGTHQPTNRSTNQTPKQ